MGKVSATISTHGILNLDSVYSQIQDIIYDQTSINLELENVGVNMPDSLIHVNHLYGNVGISPDLITLKDFKATYDDIQFETDTTVIKNLYHTAMRNNEGRLEVQGVYRFNHINYEGLMAMISAFTATSEEDNQDEPKEELPSKPSWDYEIKGKLFVK